MKPKKRERPVPEQPVVQYQQMQADHELFLLAFEKPTQIYRYLRTRSIVSPIFLHRNLKYMSGRHSRKANTRENFNVNSILEKVEAKHKKELQTDSYKSEFMNLTFTGLTEKGEDLESAEVEVFLLKICHKKRKDVSSPVTQVSVGKVTVPCNPDPCYSPRAAAVSIGSDNFNHNNGHSVKSYVLVFRATCVRKALPNGICNGDLSDSEETPVKKRKNGKSSPYAEEEELEYCTQLVVYDKHKRCLLTEGDYEIVLQDTDVKMTHKKTASWETVMGGQCVGPFEVFSSSPTLKLRLSWSVDPMNGLVDTPVPIPAATEFLNNNQYNNHVADRREAVPSRKEQPLEKKSKDAAHSPKRKRIFYQFLYNNNTRQQTEARDDHHCPWCSLNCSELFSLLKHLRLCHARFNFTYSEHPKGARIDVSINERYDGSYVGNPQDLHSHIGYAFSRNGPVRRTPVTHVIVYRPKKPSFDLIEFLEPEVSDSHNNRQFIQGHNRLYYHIVTCLPVRAEEIDVDSEDEHAPEWLKQKTRNLIDDFTDVNEGEKEVMKMWNVHIMHNNYIGDCQLPVACSTFVEEYGPEIVQKNLCRNFLLHMVSLYDFSLVKPEVVQKTMLQLQKLKEEMDLTSEPS